MKKLFGALFMLLGSVAAALWFRGQGGFVLVRIGDLTIEFSVILFVGATLAAAFLAYLIIGMVRRLLGVPSGVRRWLSERKQDRARIRLVDGLIRLTEGRYADAEGVLIKNVERSDAPVLHYMAAAVAAQQRSALDRRDNYLAMADHGSRRTRLAVGLVQAQLQQESNQWEQSLATLNYLYERSPHNSRVLKLLMKCCLALKDWDRLGKLLPELRRYDVVDDQTAVSLELESATHRLEKASGQTAQEVDRVWNSLSRTAREEPALVLGYVDALCAHNRGNEAEKVLRQRLNRNWNSQLAERYGQLDVEPAVLLGQIEKWLRDRPEDSVLLHAAGRQALRQRLWGRARSYLEAAVVRAPQVQSYQLLGGLLEQYGEHDAARDCFRKALELATGVPTLAELSEPERLALAAHARTSPAP